MTIQELNKGIQKYFNFSELKDICLELNIEYEDLSGDTRKDIARELVQYCKRNNSLDELVQLCRELRPHVVWEDLSIQEELLNITELNQSNEKNKAFVASKSKVIAIAGGIVFALSIIADVFGIRDGIKSVIQDIVESTPISSEPIMPIVSDTTLVPSATVETEDIPTNESQPAFYQGYTPTSVIKNGYEFVQVPAGIVQIGSDEIFIEEYWIGKYEVTNEQFVTFLNALKSSNSCFNSRPCIDIHSETLQIYQDEGVWRTVQGYLKYPVVEVTYEGAREFCQKAIDNSDLPNSVQWIKAASWHPETNQIAIFPWGNNQPRQQLANYDKNENGSLPVTELELGRSVVGAFNMSGNVWEFIAVSEGAQLTWVGGGWRSPANNINVYAEDKGFNVSENDIGFRCAREE